jgi:hypothetical protein
MSQQTEVDRRPWASSSTSCPPSGPGRCHSARQGVLQVVRNLGTSPRELHEGMEESDRPGRPARPQLRAAPQRQLAEQVRATRVRAEAKRSDELLTALCNCASLHAQPHRAGLAVGKSGQHTVSQQMRLDRPAAELGRCGLAGPGRARARPVEDSHISASVRAWRSPSSSW